MKGRGLKVVIIEEVFYKMRYIRGGRDERKGMKGRRGWEIEKIGGLIYKIFFLRNSVLEMLKK